MEKLQDGSISFQFGEWLPDVPVLNNPGVSVIKNLIPSGNSYKPFPNPAISSANALAARAQGAFATLDNSDNPAIFAGDVSKLYRLSDNSWTSVSGNTTYLLSPEDRWFFTQFGQKILATNFNEPIQVFTLGSSTSFTDLLTPSSSASTQYLVRSKFITSSRGFVLIGYTEDTVDGIQKERVRWSNYNSNLASPSINFIVSAVTQSDYQDLKSQNGAITQIVGGEYCVIFQEKAITRMTYVGSPLVWQFDEVESGRGTKIPGSVIKVGSDIFYIANDGFYVFDGSKSTDIGSNKVDNYFVRDFNWLFPESVYSIVDQVNQVIYWTYCSKDNPLGKEANIPNKVIMFNYAPNSRQRWSIAEVSVDCLYEGLSEGWTLDQLDDYLTPGTTTLDSLPYALDSDYWKGGQFKISGFDPESPFKGMDLIPSTDHPPLNASIETGEFQLTPNARTKIFLTRPYFVGSSINNPTSVTVSIGQRNLLNDDVLYTVSQPLNSTGNVPVRSTAQYQRLKLEITGAFEDLESISILDYKGVGAR